MDAETSSACPIGSRTFLQLTYLVNTYRLAKEIDMDEVVDVDALIDALIDREGGYVDNGADKGGPTCFGVTEAVARANGYGGPMRQLPRSEAVAIYRRLYWLRPRFDEIARRTRPVAAELFDTGVNMGPAVAVTFLQRALTALNRNGTDYPDLTPDGRIGAATLAALDSFLKVRGMSSGETVLLRALEALQGERYLRLAERRPANEAFLYGWLANRIGE
jgi:lysozyme family protein